MKEPCILFEIFYEKSRGNIKNFITFAVANRGVAQLAARHVRDVEVGSSSLLTPTEDKRIGLSAGSLDFLHIGGYSGRLHLSSSVVLLYGAGRSRSRKSKRRCISEQPLLRHVVRSNGDEFLRAVAMPSSAPSLWYMSGD